VRKALLSALILVAAVLGWGWWHSHTHADVHLAINDVALKTARQRWAPLESGALVLRDEGGRALAHGSLTAPHRIVEFSDDAAGDCGRFERQVPQDAAARAGWRACYEGRSRWQARWAGKVAYASISTGTCTIEKVPVRTRRYDDWWLWWVPLPHVGGMSSAYYAYELFVDSAACSAVTPAP
jgi:hypothetical protein